MYNTLRDIKRLKSKGWDNHNKIGSKNFKSVHAILKHFRFPVDFDGIAIAVSKNPAHELYGHTAEEISAIWKEKGEVGKKRGKWLDSYIQNKLHRTPFKDFEESKKDEIIMQKYLHFENLKKNVLEL